MAEKLNIDWMDEPLKKLPKGQGLYRLLCILLLKKYLTYSNMYVFIYGLNKHNFKNRELELKTLIIQELASIYYYNTQKLPNGFELRKL